jgi:hypothetical protein
MPLDINEPSTGLFAVDADQMPMKTAKKPVGNRCHRTYSHRIGFVSASYRSLNGAIPVSHWFPTIFGSVSIGLHGQLTGNHHTYTGTMPVETDETG